MLCKPSRLLAYSLSEPQHIANSYHVARRIAHHAQPQPWFASARNPRRRRRSRSASTATASSRCEGDDPGLQALPPALRPTAGHRACAWAAPRTPCSMPPSAASICRPSTSRSASRAGHLTPPPPAACCRRYSPFALPLLAGRANTHPAPAREALPLPRVLQAPQHRQVAGGAQPECGACVGGAAAAATSVLSRSVPRSA